MSDSPKTTYEAICFERVIEAARALVEANQRWQDSVKESDR